jgi:hypothetical protein
MAFYPYNWTTGAGGAESIPAIVAKLDLEVNGAGVAGAWATQAAELRTAVGNVDTAPVNIVLAPSDSTHAWAASRWEYGLWGQVTRYLYEAFGQPMVDAYVSASSSLGGGYPPDHIATYPGAGPYTNRLDKGLSLTGVEVPNGQHLTYTTQYPCDRIWLHYPNYAGGAVSNFSYSIDGTVIDANHSQTNADNLGDRILDSGVLTLGLHSIDVLGLGGFASIISGWSTYNGNGGVDGVTGRGIRVYPAGRFGSNTGHYSTFSAWADGMDTLAIHAMVWNQMINDLANGATAAQSRANLTTMLATVDARAAAVGRHRPTIFLYIPYATGVAATSFTAHRQMAHAWCDDNGIIPIDATSLVGYVGTATVDDEPAGYGVMSAADPAGSKKHYNTKGGRALGRHVGKFIYDVMHTARAVPLAAPAIGTTARDGTGILTLPTQLTSPSSPSSLNAGVFAELRAGRERVHMLGPAGRSLPISPASTVRTKIEARPTTGTGFSTWGSVINNGTVSTIAFTEALGLLANFASAGAAGLGGIQGNNFEYLRGSSDAAGKQNGFEYQDVGRWPDASYNTSGAATGSRIFVGMTDQTAAIACGTDDPTGNRVGFQRISATAGKTQANWFVTTKDNVTETLVDTGVVFTVAHLYEFLIGCAPGGTTFTLTITDLTNGATFTTTTSTTIPAGTVILKPMQMTLSIDAVARNSQFRHFECNTDRL